MSETRTSLKEFDLSKMIGSTAQIMVRLFVRSKGFEKITDLNEDDPILKRCVIYDAKITQLHNKIQLPTTINELPDVIRVRITKLMESPKREDKINAANFTENSNKLNNDANKVKEAYRLLQTNYRTLVTRQNESISELVQKGKSLTPGEVERTLKQLEKEYKTFESSVSHFIKEREGVSYYAVELNNNVINSLPAEYRIGLESSVQTPKLGG